MSDANIALQGVDVFSLGANFEPQDGSKATKMNVLDRKSKIGDTKEIVSRNPQFDYNCNYEYNGNNLATDLALLLGKTVATPDGDDVLVEEVSLTFGESSQVKISVKGHNHQSNPHSGVCLSGDSIAGVGLDLTNIIGLNQGGWDCPADMPFANTDSDLVSLTVNFKIDHQDKNGHDGEHLTGKCFNPSVSVSAEYTGTPTLDTTGWVVESDEDGFSNQSFDSTKISARRALVRS